MLTCLLNHNLYTNNVILGLLSYVNMLFFTIIHFHGFKANPTILKFTRCFNTLFLNFCGTHVCLPRITYNCFLGFINSIDSWFPKVAKSSIDESLNKLVKKCYRIDFFKLTCSLKISMACVNIA
jgi:hypothetical protein